MIVLPYGAPAIRFRADLRRVLNVFNNKNYDDMFSRFHTIPACYGRTDGRTTDGQTDRRTELLYQYRASVCWRAIKMHLLTCDLDLWSFNPKTMSLLGNPRSFPIPSLNTLHGIIHFWVMLRINRQTDKQTVPNNQLCVTAICPFLSHACLKSRTNSRKNIDFSKINYPNISRIVPCDIIDMLNGAVV